MFEEHGDIKTFFDLIANRGMVFVTYVRPQRRFRAQGDSTLFFSSIFERLRGLGSAYKGLRSAAGQ